MDELSEKLRRDADGIDVTVDAALRARIDAGVVPVPRPAAESSLRQSPLLLWGGVAAGLAVAVMLLLLRAPVDEHAAPEPAFAATPSYEELLPADVPLEVRTAEFTEPLQQELDALRRDLERARQRIENDLRNTL